MLSFPKILFTLAVILIVFYGAKMIGRRVTAAAAKKTPKSWKTKDKEPPRVETVDLTKCAVCDSFIAADAKNCGRADCPQGR